jgi:hypothetical protein
MDDETYWAVVEASPFEKYISHCKTTLLEGHANAFHLQIRYGQNGNSTKKGAPFEFGNDAKVRYRKLFFSFRNRQARSYLILCRAFTHRHFRNPFPTHLGKTIQFVSFQV